MIEADRLHWRLSSFQRKVERAEALIAEALTRMRRPYVAWSGGKDSTVVLALVRRQRPDVPAIWFDDELEYPESVAYMRETAALCGIDLRPVFGAAEHAGWFRPWQDRPFWREPLPGTGTLGPNYGLGDGWDGAFIGLRAAERHHRRVHLRVRGQLYQTKAGQWQCNPIGGWDVADVWAYLAGTGTPVNPVYARLTAIGVPREQQRVGPLPLSRGWMLRAGWPAMWRQLVDRYGDQWGG